MSWDQLLAIVTEAAAIREDARTTPPTACPRCGIPLQQGPRDAGLFCPAGDWRERDGPLS